MTLNQLIWMRENGGRLDFGFISSSDWATCYHLLCCSSWKKWCHVCCFDQFILFVNSKSCFLFFHIRAFSFVFDTCFHHVSYIGSFGCYMAGAMWNCCHLTHSACFVYTMIHHVPIYSVVRSCIWSFSECWVIFYSHNPQNSDMDYRMFNMSMGSFYIYVCIHMGDLGLLSHPKDFVESDRILTQEKNWDASKA